MRPASVQDAEAVGTRPKAGGFAAIKRNEPGVKVNGKLVESNVITTTYSVRCVCYIIPQIPGSVPPRGTETRTGAGDGAPVPARQETRTSGRSSARRLPGPAAASGGEEGSHRAVTRH